MVTGICVAGFAMALSSIKSAFCTCFSRRSTDCTYMWVNFEVADTLTGLRRDQSPSRPLIDVPAERTTLTVHRWCRTHCDRKANLFCVQCLLSAPATPDGPPIVPTCR
jgi:hypothetical protein